jgi:hypothetical protein
MKQKVASFIFLATSVLIGLGAFGHASQWGKVVYPVIGSQVADPRMLHLLLAVWLFVSGAMLTFALALIWAWARIRRGERSVVVLPFGIGAFYLVFGLLSWFYVGNFFALFVALGALLAISTIGLLQTNARS